jgi:hypothetical protein
LKPGAFKLLRMGKLDSTCTAPPQGGLLDGARQGLDQPLVGVVVDVGALG